MRAVIFDWDGTLADSHRPHSEAMATVMRAFGVPFSDELYRRRYSPDWRLMYRRFGLSDAQIAESSEIWQQAFHRAPPTTLLPGVPNALERLTAEGVASALVTAGARAIVEPQVRRLGIAGWIPLGVYGDDLPEQKPHPAPLLRALHELGIPAEAFASVAYLGDAPEDMAMARSAGVHAIGVVSAFSDAALLRAAGAEMVVDSVAAWVADRDWRAAGSVVRAS